MTDRVSDTPIFDALWAKYNSTPIYDQLVKEHQTSIYHKIAAKYQTKVKAVWSIEEMEAAFGPYIKFGKNAIYDPRDDIINLDEAYDPVLREKYAALFNEIPPALTKPDKATVVQIKKETKPMSTNWQDMVNEFRNAMDLPVADGPRTLSTQEQLLHIQMIRDEFEKELVPAVMANDLTEIYDAGIDTIVYIIGLLSNAGMWIDPGFIEVHASNMSKLDPATGKAIKAVRNDPSGEPEGKVLKGPNYFPPKLAAILNDQSRNGREDKTVYRSTHIPITLGIGGPKIGEGDIVMDHNGDVVMNGVMDDVAILPVIDHLGFSVSGLSVGPDRNFETGVPDGMTILRDTSDE